MTPAPAAPNNPSKPSAKPPNSSSRESASVIASGTYRECVHPARGGSSPTQMISYEAAPGAKVFIKGSDTLNDGWQPVTSTGRGGGGGAMAGRGAGAGAGGAGAASQIYMWRHEITPSMFPDAYFPFSLISLPGNWSWLNTKAVDMGPYFRRRGLVFIDGMPLEPMEQASELGNTPLISPIPVAVTTQPTGRNGLPARTRGGAIMQEIGGAPDARFYIENPGNAIQIRVPATTAVKPLVEITVREQAFTPTQRGLGYIRLKGLTFQHAGNGYPPPQRGLVSTGGGNHWIIENNTIEWANGVGLDLGNSDFSGGGGGGGGGGGNGGGAGAQAAPSGAFHIVRGNTIRYCGVEGIGGMGTQNTVIEDNLIEWCGWADAERAWEAAAAKFHSSRNLLVRRNVIRHIRHANALWLDSGNSNCRITSNVIADVLTVSAAIHMEMNRNYNQIDNNIVWNIRNSEPGTPGQRGAAGSGVFCHATDGLIVVNNLFGLCDNTGFWPTLRPERSGAGVGTENYIQNNIFTRCGKSAVVLLSPQNKSDGNLLVDMPQKSFIFLADDKEQAMDLTQWRETRSWDKNSLTANLKIDFDPDKLDLTFTGDAKLPALPIVNKIDADITGKSTPETRLPGPLATPTSQHIDPRNPKP